MVVESVNSRDISQRDVACDTLARIGAVAVDFHGVHLDDAALLADSGFFGIIDDARYIVAICDVGGNTAFFLTLGFEFVYAVELKILTDIQDVIRTTRILCHLDPDTVILGRIECFVCGVVERTNIFGDCLDDALCDDNPGLGGLVSMITCMEIHFVILWINCTLHIIPPMPANCVKFLRTKLTL